MRTHWGQRKEMKKCPLPTPNPQLKRKKIGAPLMRDVPSNWLHANSISKTGYQYFWPQLIGIPNDTILDIGVYNDLHYLHGVPPKILFYFFAMR
jgi:hypothetical protein